MLGLGTAANCAAIIAGGSAGLLIKKGVPEDLERRVRDGLGVAVILIGVSGALQGVLQTAGGQAGLNRVNLLALTLSIIIGTAIGWLLKLEKRFDAFGGMLSDRFARGSSKFSEGFVTAAVIYCVGAMAILGAMDDGLGKPETLLVKAVLDGVMSVVLASSLGAGVIFSAIPVGVYQGLIMLTAVFLRPFASAELLAQMSLAGSAVIMCIGFNLLELSGKKISVATMLPATFTPILFEIMYHFTGFRIS